MATGRGMQVTRQIGEHLVVAELGRLGYVAAPFAGNVPMFDLLAADAEGFTVPIQVKAINSGSWQGKEDQFLTIEMDGDDRIMREGREAAQLLNPDLICVYVFIKGRGNDEFYIFRLRDLQDYYVSLFKSRAREDHGIWRLRRAKKPQSLHCAVSPKHLDKYRDNWGLVESTLAAQRQTKRKR